MARHAELAALDLPDFGLPTAQPSIPTTTYQARIAAAMARAKELGQPRGQSAMLKDILLSAGLRRGQQLGLVGWKSFDSRESNDPAHTLELPSFIVDALTDITGDRQLLFNATDIFMGPATGLRATNDVDQLASFEFAATHSSQAVRNLLFGVRAGMTELDAVSR